MSPNVRTVHALIELLFRVKSDLIDTKHSHVHKVNVLVGIE